uniref:Uncharacterized protein n=1 Tax=Aegilops tauschii subsp. strangulata TaxID=200361 RepID=A0A453HDJ4_AEGTS
MQATARQVEDKECYSYTTNGAANGRPHRKNPAASSRLKPMPSKWDDAQKWLVGMSNGGGDGLHGGGGKAAKPRNSNADDRRLLSSSSQNGRISCSSVDGGIEYNMVAAPPTPPQLGEDDVGETKNMDCSMVRPHAHGSPVSVCLRDMGTEMTPIASKEPSRAATPLRSTTPVARSPIPSRSSTPGRRRQDAPPAGALGSDVVRTAEQPAVSGRRCSQGQHARVPRGGLGRGRAGQVHGEIQARGGEDPGLGEPREEKSRAGDEENRDEGGADEGAGAGEAGQQAGDGAAGGRGEAGGGGGDAERGRGEDVGEGGLHPEDRPPALLLLLLQNPLPLRL